ncbi:hypothetical protein E2C01_048202 [Portunus trituberculatus]|uniref:Uncharacterized protein n=1 Tax=Portunus trituberculatus TaxID=210409 RepID=A0A5B7G5S6_PORTR|nr:hypothetical protein [Portunus trituberculatus]
MPETILGSTAGRGASRRGTISRRALRTRPTLSGHPGTAATHGFTHN